MFSSDTMIYAKDETSESTHPYGCSQLLDFEINTPLNSNVSIHKHPHIHIHFVLTFYRRLSFLMTFKY